MLVLLAGAARTRRVAADRQHVPFQALRHVRLGHLQRREVGQDGAGARVDVERVVLARKGVDMVREEFGHLRQR